MLESSSNALPKLQMAALLVIVMDLSFKYLGLHLDFGIRFEIIISISKS
jgi:hypothetical protein